MKYKSEVWLLTDRSGDYQERRAEEIINLLGKRIIILILLDSIKKSIGRNTIIQGQKTLEQAGVLLSYDFLVLSGMLRKAFVPLPGVDSI